MSISIFLDNIELVTTLSNLDGLCKEITAVDTRNTMMMGILKAIQYDNQEFIHSEKEIHVT